MITTPPRINALPWIRSAHAHAFRPPAVTYAIAMTPMISDPVARLREKPAFPASVLMTSAPE